MIDYSKMAEILQAKLSDAEFVRLFELIDEDGNGVLYDSIGALVEKAHPEMFARPAFYHNAGEGEFCAESKHISKLSSSVREEVHLTEDGS